MTEYARTPPPFCEDAFYLRCYDLVQLRFALDVGSQVNVNNCIEVYTYLINNV